MSKIVLISLSILVIASAGNLKGSVENLEGNYDRAQAVLQAFMNNYTSTQYNMTLTCFTPKIQSSLDQILAASVGYIVTGHFDSALKSFEEFVQQFAASCEQCGLSQVSYSLTTGLGQKGKFWYEVNLVANLENVVRMSEEFAKLFTEKKFQLAGAELGLLTEVLIPYIPHSQAMLGSMDTTGYKNWWKGLVASLLTVSKKYGPCANFMLGLGNNTANSYADVSMILSKDLAGFNNLFGDLAGSLTYWQKNYTGDFCYFENLVSNIEELTQKGGVTTLLTRYASRVLSINAAFVSIKDCGTNYYSCGQGYGTIIKYLLNWSIY